MHSEKPWHWEKGNDTYHKELVGPIGGEDSILYHGSNWPMKEEDMLLIQHAPELLEAVERLLPYVGQGDIPSNPDFVFAMRIIKTVKGESKNDKRSIKKGHCPNCNSENLEHEPGSFQGSKIYFPFTCMNCKFEGNVWYFLSFDCFTDIDNNEIR